MYSVILMAALTASTAEAPTFGHKGCCGCCGGVSLHSGCYGCSGCSGCYGCWGSCYGCSGCYGCMGCYGAYSGCYGCMGCYGVSYSSDGAIVPTGNPMQTVPGATTTPGTTPATPTAPPKTGTSAKVIIEKPADAKIYVDNQLVKSEGTRQSFVTPVLDPSQAYYYTVRVESVRDGKPSSETRRLIVRSGETAQATFAEPAIVTASAAK
jgi:uncharacterized protein (TIGR03000 family)